MPKGKNGRPLAGAALAAYNRAHHKSGSTALARRPSQAVAGKTKTRTVYVPVKAKKKKHGGGMTRSGGGGGGVGGAIASLKAQTWDIGGAVTYGYLTGNDDQKAIDLRAKTLDHLPTSEKLGKPLSHGLVLTGVAALAPPGIIRKIAGHLAHAALMRAGHNFGAAGGDTDKFATMSGEEGGETISGGIDE